MQGLRRAVLAIDRVTTTVVTWAACAALALAAAMAFGQVVMRYYFRADYGVLLPEAILYGQQPTA